MLAALDACGPLSYPVWRRTREIGGGIAGRRVKKERQRKAFPGGSGHRCRVRDAPAGGLPHEVDGRVSNRIAKPLTGKRRPLTGGRWPFTK